jgi:hypothetical protein
MKQKLVFPGTLVSAFLLKAEGQLKDHVDPLVCALLYLAGCPGCSPKLAEQILSRTDFCQAQGNWLLS